MNVTELTVRQTIACQQADFSTVSCHRPKANEEELCPLTTEPNRYGGMLVLSQNC